MHLQSYFCSIYIHIYIYIHIHIHILLYIHVYIHFIHMYLLAQSRMCAFTDLCTYIYVCICMHLHTKLYVCPQRQIGFASTTDAAIKLVSAWEAK